MAWHEGLRDEIESMFDSLSVPSICGGADGEEGRTARLDGFHLHGYLCWTLRTTKERLTFEQRRLKRQQLEVNRRAYKTTKQRQYDQAKRAVVA